jgi:disulfide bond formation protein DsbB
VLTGAGECQKIDWSLLGLSMPAWVFMSVFAIAVVGVWSNARSSQ